MNLCRVITSSLGIGCKRCASVQVLEHKIVKFFFDISSGLDRHMYTREKLGEVAHVLRQLPDKRQHQPSLASKAAGGGGSSSSELREFPNSPR